MNHNATIIGAGPAGCVAAIILARGGWNVRLIEQHRFPRDKVCGECLSALGYNVLQRLGLADSFMQLSPVRLEGTIIHPSRGASVQIPLRQPMWGISRLRFDLWLMEHARNAGAQIPQPARCEHIDESAPAVTVRDLKTNRISEIPTAVILLADGKRALATNRPAPTRDLGIKAHFENIRASRDAIELFGVNGHYGGIAPIETGRWNVAFSVPRARVQAHRGDLDGLFDSVARDNMHLKQTIEGARRCTPWLASPLPRFAPSRSCGGNVIPIGNAAASIEPIGGEGIGLAMRSAELAARMLLTNRLDLDQLRRDYAKLWRMRSAGCRAAAVLVSHRSLANWTAPKLKHAPIFSRAMMMLMGK
jgi:flavin-dependent dehydrogenase